MPEPRYTAAPLRTSRELADRLDHDFPKDPDRFRKWLAWLSFGACLGVVAWLIVAAARSGRTIYEAGPVAPSHRFFENNCTTCHTTWAPASRLTALAGDGHRVTSVDDASCQACHVGSPHYAGQSPPHDGLGCATCHREHRHDATLLAGANAQCLKCHGALSDQLAKITAAPGALPRDLPAISITSFSSDHPEFDALARPDPTPLQFNHRVHLQHEYDDQGKLIKGVMNERGELEDLSKNCAACHRPDSQKLYMAPIRYAQHCQRCHPLYFDNANFPGEVVPHGVPAATLRGFLTEQYTAPGAQRRLENGAVGTGSSAPRAVSPRAGALRRRAPSRERGCGHCRPPFDGADCRLAGGGAPGRVATRTGAVRPRGAGRLPIVPRGERARNYGRPGRLPVGVGGDAAAHSRAVDGAKSLHARQPPLCRVHGMPPGLDGQAAAVGVPERGHQRRADAADRRVPDVSRRKVPCGAPDGWIRRGTRRALAMHRLSRLSLARQGTNERLDGFRLVRRAGSEKRWFVIDVSGGRPGCTPRDRRP